MAPNRKVALTSKVRRFLPSLAGSTLARYIELVHRTSKIEAEPDNYAAILKANHPLILAVWHGQFLLTPKINVEGLPTQIVVADHPDAEIIGHAFARFNVGLIRGAGAGSRKRIRGGAGALRNAIKALKNEHSLCMTADVPPGPAREVGLGMVALARLSGRPIVPAAMATKHFWALKNWSRMTINLPFSRLGLVLGEPIVVPRMANTQELEVYRLEVEQALNDVTKRAYELARGNLTRATPSRALSQMGINPKSLSIGRRLQTYKRLTSLARPIAPWILKYRERQQKEDPARRVERFGIASRSRPEGTLVWYHAASVGELNAVMPLIDALQNRRPDLKSIVTTGTVTSAQLAAARLGPGAIHQFIPLDAPEYVAKFLQHWTPDLAVFAESEIWPNLILESAASEVPMVLVNGRISNRSFNKWRRKSDMAAPLFGRFDYVLAQNEKLARRFSELGARKALAVGNLKIDSPAPPVDQDALKSLRVMIGGRRVFIGASTHDGEDEIIARTHSLIKAEYGGFLTIIAPRHPVRADAIEQMLRTRELNVARRSTGEMLEADTDVYVADTIGELGTFYAVADVAFIGGSLITRGGQNPIEAIRHNTCVLTGPHWTNFRDEYKALIKSGAVSEVVDAQEMATAVLALFADEAVLSRRRQKALQVLEELSGALGRTVDVLLPLLPDVPVTPSRKDLQRAS